MSDNWIIIPDLHGRSFWKEAVKGREDENIIFLGDYLDPYSFDGITPAQATSGLEEVIAFKKEHKENVILLLGNHDLGYLDENVCDCRHDYYRKEQNRRLLLDNIALFDIVHETVINGQPVLFSHAGLRESWVKENAGLFGAVEFTPSILNAMLQNPDARPNLLEALGQMSAYRGGYDAVGSPVWTDVREYMNGADFFPGYLHVFGHTLHNGGPIHVKNNTGEGWCLDCAQAFRLDRDCQTRNLTDGSIVQQCGL